jgi:hypothetical protein
LKLDGNNEWAVAGYVFPAESPVRIQKLSSGDLKVAAVCHKKAAKKVS